MSTGTPPSMLVEIKGDLPCYSDVLRVHDEDWRRAVVLLSMVGPHNAVRSAWATISKSGRRGRVGAIEVGDTRVGLKDGVAYSTSTAPLDRGLLHLVIYHPMLSHNAPDLGFFYQVGPDACHRYFGRLQRRCEVPLRAAWRARLWDLGRAAGAITEMRGHGLEVWHVSTTRDAWEPIVRAALVDRGMR